MDARKLIAHRGDNTNYPENTLIAFEEALKAGALFFEFDIHMNADQRLVVFHDSNFLRMNGESRAKIMDVTHDEMASLSIHQPGRFGDKYKPTGVSYIEDILELLNQYPNAHAFVEVKRASLAHWGLALVMDKVLDSLKGFENQATIISFSHDSLAYAKKHRSNNDLSIGYVFEEYSEENHAIATELNPEYLVCDYTILPEKDLWQGQWKWGVYTINDVELAEQLLSRGDLEFVETDDIQLFLKQ